MEFVYAQEHEETLARLQMEHRKTTLLESLVRQLAWTTPRNDEWEHSYRALQSQARRLLSTLTRDAGNPDPPESRQLPA
ncbi:MAG: hypothetical protein KIS79_04810 [Burkholderiales bacterium]|nr:hypothetical protein [Burkholderiales bacterium]